MPWRRLGDSRFDAELNATPVVAAVVPLLLLLSLPSCHPCVLQPPHTAVVRRHRRRLLLRAAATSDCCCRRVFLPSCAVASDCCRRAPPPPATAVAMRPHLLHVVHLSPCAVFDSSCCRHCSLSCSSIPRSVRYHRQAPSPHAMYAANDHCAYSCVSPMVGEEGMSKEK